MATVNTLQPQNLPEKLVWYAIRYTWVFYLFGALYIIGPAVGWLLLAFMLYQFCFGKSYTVSASQTAWIVGMAVMLLAVFVGHINQGLGMGSLIKSSVGWAKGWALMAIFILIASLNIRPEIIVRASMHLCKQCLYIIPFVVIAALISLPSHLYTSPLKFLASHSFFEVELYGINPFDGMPRWRLFTPWGPALGLIGNMLFCMSLMENNRKLRWIGIIASILMVLLSKSRMGLLCLIAAPVGAFILAKLNRTVMLLAIAVAAPLGAALYVPAMETVERLEQQVHAARADSSRVRGALARIAIERWRTEAPIWGHGVVEKGPHYVEYMPIGSHHSWYGLLFVKGVVGAIALALPLLLTLIQTTLNNWQRPNKYTIGALQITLLLCAYSLTENLEILSYLYWPALILLGGVLRQGFHLPQKNRSSTYPGELQPQ